MNAREEILQRIRAARPGTSDPETVTAPPTPDVLDHEALLELFVENLIDYRAVVSRCGPTEVARTVDRALAAHSCRRVVLAPALPEQWHPTETELVIDDDLGATQLNELDAVVTASAIAIAQTGTIVLDHQPDQGRRALSLVPDVHVCVVRAEQVVTSVPEAVGKLHESAKAGRPQTWISGPSATSDIELDRVEGVHGPRHLEVVIVE